MVDLQIQDFDDAVRDKLVELARQQGISLNDLVCDSLRKAVLTKGEPATGLETRLAERFAAQGLTAELPEWRRPETADV